MVKPQNSSAAAPHMDSCPHWGVGVGIPHSKGPVW